MSAHQETYRGCEIKISAEGHLTVATKPIDYEFDSSKTKWISRYLPYSQYDSLLELAKAIIDNTEEFVDGSN